MLFTDKEKEILNHEHIFEAYKFVSEHRFWIAVDHGGQEVKIRIDEDVHGRYHFRQSHYIQTPDQASPYLSSRTIEDTPEAALYNAVRTITSDYDRAISRGERPKAEWFVPNERY